MNNAETLEVINLDDLTEDELDAIVGANPEDIVLKPIGEAVC